MPLVNDAGSIAMAHVRAQDNKDRWLVALDPDTGAARVVDALHDDAWVREAGGFGPQAQGSFGWMADGRHSGFSPSATAGCTSTRSTPPPTTPRRGQLTSGKWEIESAALSPDKQTFYLTTTEAAPGERQIYAMAADGGDAHAPDDDDRRVQRASSRPTSRTFGLVYSYSNKPPEVYVMAERARAPRRPR